MKITLQRTSYASVMINHEVKSDINTGFLILLGIGVDDTKDDIDWLCNKIINLRVFNDVNGKMNLNIKDVNGDILLVSQFTLFASTKKGNRPSFIKSAKPQEAIPLYHKFIEKLEELIGKSIQTGEFGADMQVSLINDGPVTIVIDSKNRE